MACESSRHRRNALSAVGLGLALLLAGCGSSGGGVAHLGKVKLKVTITKPAAVLTPQRLPAVETAVIKFATCMRSHGVVNFPDPGAPGGTSSAKAVVNPDSPTVKSAVEACKSLLPSVASGTLPALSGALQSDFLRAVACMRTHGVPNMPDPTFVDGVPHFQGILKKIDLNSPVFQSALSTCKSLLPGGGAL
jgi:hypothetical protein